MEKKEEKILTFKESYEVMLHFLETWYKSSKSKDLTDILSPGKYFEDGNPMDPIVGNFWEEAIQAVQNGENDPFLKLKS